MKTYLIDFLKLVLKKLARATIWRYRPGVVGITGSVGKTSTKLAVAAVLSTERSVRSARWNFNDEVGIPLTILGDWHEKDLKLFSRAYGPGENRMRKVLFFMKVVATSLFRIIIKGKYPEILVLEYGIDRPGNMRSLLEIVRPNVSVLTAIGEVPAHVEFFTGPEEVAREKGRLIECLPSAGFAILNHDDEVVVALKERTRAHALTFGFGKGSMVQVASFKNEMEGDRPVGVSFKLEYGGSFVPVRLSGVFGRAQGYASAAAAAVGIVFGMNLVKISESLQNYKPAPHRLELIPGIKYTYLLDDSYNASPLSMHASLHVLDELPGKRKIAVLGDMLEIGNYTMEEHERLGKLVRETANILIAIGPRAKFIAEGARKAGMQKRSMQIFETVEEAQKPVQDLLRKGDLALIKASHAMGFEKLVEEVKAF